MLHTNLSDQDMQGVVDLINNRDVDLDLAIFLGTDHIKLMKMLNNKTNLFQLPYTALIPDSEIGEIVLRLDTSIVAVKEFRETYLQWRDILLLKNTQRILQYHMMR